MYVIWLFLYPKNQLSFNPVTFLIYIPLGYKTIVIVLIINIIEKNIDILLNRLILFLFTPLLNNSISDNEQIQMFITSFMLFTFIYETKTKYRKKRNENITFLLNKFLFNIEINKIIKKKNTLKQVKYTETFGYVTNKYSGKKYVKKNKR